MEVRRVCSLVRKLDNRLRYYDLNYFQTSMPIPGSSDYYLPIEKNACSTVKKAIYLKKYGSEYNGDIHDYWASCSTLLKIRQKAQKLSTVAILREPVDRFWSAYQDLIVKRLWAVDYFPNKQPDLEFFLNHFDQFMKHRGLKLHFAAQASYINKTTKLYRFDQIGEFFQFYRLPSSLKENTSSIAKERNLMENEVENFVAKRYASDVKIYNGSA